MYRKMTAVLAVAGIVTIAGSVRAITVGQTVEVEVYATINSTLQLTLVGSTSYDFGVIAANSQNITATTFQVDNTSAGMSCDLQLQGTNALPGPWTIAPQGSGPAADQFALYGQLNFPAQPTPAALFTANMQIDNTLQPATVLKYAGNQNGDNVAVAGQRMLWVGLWAPTSSTTTTRKRVQINIAAINP